ncbi:MAG: hypothetical protein ABWY49_04525 [Rhizobium sp.]
MPEGLRQAGPLRVEMTLNSVDVADDVPVEATESLAPRTEQGYVASRNATANVTHASVACRNDSVAELKTGSQHGKVLNRLGK